MRAKPLCAHFFLLFSHRVLCLRYPLQLQNAEVCALKNLALLLVPLLLAALLCGCGVSEEALRPYLSLSLIHI